MRKRVNRLHEHILALLLLLLPLGAVDAQQAPTLYLLSDGEAVHIILHNTPPGTAGFKAFRRGPGEDAFRPLTTEPVRAESDPHRAFRIIGDDAGWLAQEFGSSDPVRLWRKMEANRNRALAYSLVSPGLRMALGRTLIDRSVKRRERYRYRIELIDRRGEEIETIYERIRVNEADEAAPPKKVQADASDGLVEIEWDYPSYRGASDSIVGFHVYRKTEGGEARRINSSPVLRIEGYLTHYDRSAREGVGYRYGVQAIDITGRLGPIRYSETLRMADTSPPLVPMGITVVDRPEGVVLLWDLSPQGDVASYRVYRSDSLEGDYRRLNEKPIPFDSPEFVDHTAGRGSLHFYKVSAVDEAGNESPKSGAVSIIPADAEPPGPVKGLEFSVDGEARSVELRWEPSEDADLRGYHLYRRRGDGSYTRLTGKPLESEARPRYEDTGFRETGLRPGERYGYALAAVDQSGNEGQRTEVVIEIPDLVPPRGVFSFSARPTRAGGVRLRWQPSLSKDLAVHLIYREGEEGTELLAELPKAETEYLDEDVVRGRPYSYWVVEVDADGNAAEPSERKEVVPVDIVAPGPPRNLRVLPRKRGLRLSWEAPADTDIDSYRVYRADYPGAKVRLISEEALEEEEYALRRGSEGEVYTVTAIDSSGNEGEGSSIRIEGDDR